VSGPESVHFERLSNGLSVLLREARLAPVVDLQVWAQVGSADERDTERGLAHFHEHMLFKGTAKRGVGDVAGEVEGAGGRINAYTSFDMTVYHATLPRERWATGLDVLADAVRFSRFDPEEIEREIEVVLEEIRRSEDAPFHVLGDAVFREAYRTHPYRHPILGTAESVSAFDREGLLRFFDRWYAPDNLLVVACGDFDAREVAEGVRAAFGDAEPRGVRRDRAVEPPQQQLRAFAMAKPFERVRMELAWTAPAFRSPDAVYLDLLSFLLGECESSRLVQRVKEGDALVDRIDSGCFSPLDPGLFSVEIETDTARAANAVAAAVREVERMRQEPVSEAELERARANFLASEHFERESVSGMGRKLGGFQVLGGDWHMDEEVIQRIRSATPADLQRVARQYLRPETLTAGALLPEEEAGAVDAGALERAVAEGAERTRRTFSAPRRQASPEGVHSYRIAAGEGEGAWLHVVPRPDLPVVAARVAFLGGQLAEDDASAGLTRFLTGAWMRGTRSRSAADFARSVENLAADIDAFSGRNSLGLTLECTSDRWLPALELFSEVLIEPGFDAEEIERERRDVLAAIERREDRLAQLAFLQFARTLYPSHPYRLPLLGDRAGVEAFDVSALAAHHRRLVRAENAVMGVVGDVDPDAAAEAVSVRLAGLPSGAYELALPEPDPPPDAVREADLVKDRAQAHLLLGFQALRVDDPDRNSLEVIAQLLAGQGGRLFLELRDRRGLAYAVNALNVEGVAPGFFAVYIATAPEKLDEARKGMLTELERLVQEKVPQPELDRAKLYLTGNFAIDQQRASSRAAHVALDALYGLGPDAERRYAADIAAVSTDDVLRVARRILRLDAYTLSLVHP